MKGFIGNVLLLTLLLCGGGQAVNNPSAVLLKGAMVRHAGSYYALGAETNGQLFASNNLLDWARP